MFHQDNLLSAEELLRDDNGAESVVSRRSGLRDRFSTDETRFKDVLLTLRITCASPRSIPNALAGSMRASMHVNTRYFFAGGRARCPCVKDEEYASEAAWTWF